MRYGLQFTEYQESTGACMTWFRWFEDRGVPAAIIRVGEKFAVYRRGIVGRKNTDGSTYSLDCDKVTQRFAVPPAIVISCNGYVNP